MVTLADEKEDKPSDLGKLVELKTEEIEEEAKAESDEFIKQIQAQDIPKIGEKIKGKVLDSTKNEIFIDLGSFGVGVVRGRELWEALDVFRDFTVGEKIEAEIVDMENELGMMELSFKKTSKEQAWKELEDKMKKEELVTVKVQEVNKGGLLTTLCGIPAFLPVSQLSSEHYPRVENGDTSKIMTLLRDFIGRKLDVKIITVDQRENKLILSEKKVVFDEQKKYIKKIKVGDIVKGTVSGVVDFGAFVKFGNLEGLVHISELSWKRINNPDEVVKIGDEVKVEVIGVDDTKITLSMKKLQNDPWVEAVKNYKVGEIVEGEVIKTAPYGAFVQLDKDVHGLAHVSELSSKKVEKTENVLNIGNTYKFKILSIDPEEHRMGLSLKAARSTGSEQAKEKIDDSKKDKKVADVKETKEKVDKKKIVEEKPEKKEDKPKSKKTATKKVKKKPETKDKKKDKKK